MSSWEYFAGAFSRKFTKYYDFVGPAYLKLVHTHTLALGFLTLMAVYLLVKNYDRERILALKKSYYTYITGFTIFIVSMLLKGIYTVVSQGQEIISLDAIYVIVGIGHTVLTIGIIWMFYKIYKYEKIDLANDKWK